MIPAGRRGTWIASVWLTAALSSCQPASPPARPAPVEAPAPVLAAAPTQAAPSASVAAPPAPVETAQPVDPLTAELGRLVEQNRAPLLSRDGKRLARFGSSWSEEASRERTSLWISDLTGGRVVKTITVDGSETSEVQRKKLDEMEAVLRAEPWTPLTIYQTEHDPAVEPRAFGLGETTPMRAVGEGLTVSFREPVLTVTDDRGRALHRRAYPSWSPHITRFGQSCAMFTDLSSVVGLRSRGILLVTVHWIGTPHFCEGGAQEHLVVLPGRRPA